MRIELEKTSRDAAARLLTGYLKDELGAEITRMEAVMLTDFIAEQLGPHFYNQALRDARTLLEAKVEALGEAFYELEKPAKL